MSRPLLITDCDEVLLHMVVPFRDWLDEVHDVHFNLDQHNFIDALRQKACDTVLEQGRVWELLNAFFATEMHRQYPITGAFEALQSLSQVADIAVLTNIAEVHHDNRITQLAHLGVRHPIFWNQGGKGAPLAKIIADRGPSVTVFIDDLPQHHESVTRYAPHTWRLHMVGEPLIAGGIAPAAFAHDRIDNWIAAEAWIRSRFDEGPAPVPPTGADLPSQSA
ncbi:MAG: HAD family hydrolase [Sphingobium sp.]